MRRSSLIMNIHLLLIFVYAYVGFSKAAPRIGSNDVSPVYGKRVSASGTWQIFRTDMPHSSTGRGITLKPSARLMLASTFNPEGPSPLESETLSSNSGSATAPKIGVNTASQEQVSGQISRLTHKRSTDAKTTFFSSDKAEKQPGMMFMVSQKTGSYAWASDNTDTSLTSAENIHDNRCNCSSGAEGILDPDECDQDTGQCSCLAGYTGLQCEDCEDGFFTNGTSGCLACACDSFGAVHLLCDSLGICECKTGVYGPKCDECHPGFFHFSSTGCRPCHCHNHTSYCHPQSGGCLNCEGNTQGSNCEMCKPGFYRNPENELTEPCLPCPCSNSTSNGLCHIGVSGSPECDLCLPNYAGLHCDECSAGLYKSSKDCVPCECNGNADPRGPAQICHPKTGHCLQCTNNTTGSWCHLCAPGFIGDAKAHNCSSLATRTMTETSTPSAVSPSASTSSTVVNKVGVTSVSRSVSTFNVPLSTAATTQTMLSSISSPTDNTTAALTEVSWTQFNIIILAVIILVVVLLLSFVGGVYMYREYQNRKLNAPFWTIELKEDNISFSSYHDSIPNADVSGLLEDESNVVVPNGQLTLSTQGNCFKA